MKGEMMNAADLLRMANEAHRAAEGKYSQHWLSDIKTEMRMFLGGGSEDAPSMVQRFQQAQAVSNAAALDLVRYAVSKTLDEYITLVRRKDGVPSLETIAKELSEVVGLGHNETGFQLQEAASATTRKIYESSKELLQGRLLGACLSYAQTPVSGTWVENMPDAVRAVHDMLEKTLDKNLQHGRTR